MAANTVLFQQLPWTGGLNTSLDDSMIGPGQLTVADNLIFDTRGSRKKRDGIKHNYDSASSSDNTLIALHDYWFGDATRVQRMVSVSSDRKVYSYASGTRTELTVDGTPWAGTLAQASMMTFNNLCIITVDGPANVVKYWDGNPAHPVRDLPASYTIPLVSRSSTGTTRSLVFKRASPVIVGDIVVVTGVADTTYNGTFTVTALTTTTVTNDTISYVGPTSLTEALTAEVTGDVGNHAPKGSICREHLGRIWMNDKDRPDFVHYCETADHTKWLGFGDSGGFPIGEGDGDPDGVTAIFPTFRGDTFVGKRTKLYRLSGQFPESIQVVKMSDSVGCVSHKSVASIGSDDIMFVSDKGVHSVVAVNTYGDFSGADVSVDIQKTFNEDITKTRLRFCEAAYLPNINSVAFALTETSSRDRVLTTSGVNNTLYLYNTAQKAWYRWNDLPCAAICVANDSDRKRFYLGTHTGRLSKTFNGVDYDISPDGLNLAIRYRVVTGQLLLDGSPYTSKALKRFILYYRPKGKHQLTVTIKIDDISLNPENALLFIGKGGTPLGTGFKLGTTVLGSSAIFGPQVRHIDGIGRGVKLSIEQTGIEEDIEIQGFAIEYVPAGTKFE